MYKVENISVDLKNNVVWYFYIKNIIIIIMITIINGLWHFVVAIVLNVII